ncbi:MAG: hypothetical protein ACQEP1_04860 [Nanobdellota archaeon]
MIKIKKKCIKCKKNYVEATTRSRYVICYPCQKDKLNTEIKDPEMKKFFDIPEELYERSPFLRNIKVSYIEYGEITDKQKEAFLKAYKEMSKNKE